METKDARNIPPRRVRAPNGARALARGRRGRVVPLLPRIGPVTQTLGCMLLIGLLALLYLSRVAAVSAANQRLQTLQAEQTQLLRQDQLAHQQLGQAQSPAYIRRRAGELGLVPAPPGTVEVIAAPGPGTAPGQAGTGGQP